MFFTSAFARGLTLESVDSISPQTSKILRGSLPEYFTPSMFFTSAIAGGLLPRPKRFQFTSGLLSILVHHNNAAAWMVSCFPPIFNCSNLCLNSSEAIYFTVTHIVLILLVLRQIPCIFLFSHSLTL